MEEGHPDSNMRRQKMYTGEKDIYPEKSWGMSEKYRYVKEKPAVLFPDLSGEEKKEFAEDDQGGRRVSTKTICICAPVTPLVTDK